MGGRGKCLAAAASAILFSALCTVTPAAAQGMDAVIVLDTSGSMRSADPDMTAIDGAALFASMLQEDAMAGLVTFSSQVETVMPLTGERESILAALREKKAQGTGAYTGDTNIGEALETAVEMFPGQEEGETDAPGRDRMVVFFTDGRIDLDNNGRVDPEEEENRALSGRAAFLAAEKNITICCIGLNGAAESAEDGAADSTADAGPDMALLEELAGETGGTCRETRQARELPGIFQEIFADHIDSLVRTLPDVRTDGEGRESYFDIDIPDGSVMEADAVIAWETGGETGEAPEIRLYDPEGKEAATGGDGAALLRSCGGCSVLKLIAPKQGTWRAAVQTQAPCTLHLSLICSYDAELEAALQVKGRGEDCRAVLRAWFSHDGEAVTDPDFYAQFTSAYVEVTDAQGKQDRFDMEAEGTAFRAKIPLEPGKLYSLRAVAESSRVRRESPEVQAAGEISTEKETEPETAPPPRVKAGEGQAAVRLGGLFADRLSGKLRLSDLFEAGPDTGALRYETAPADPLEPVCVKTETRGDVLLVTGKKNGTQHFLVTAVDDESGQQAQRMVEVRVEAVFGSLSLLLGALAGAAAGGAVLALIALLKGRRGAPAGSGLLQWRYEDEEEAEDAVFDSSLEPSRFGMDAVTFLPGADPEELRKIRFRRSRRGLALYNTSKTIKLFGADGAPRKRLRLCRSGEAFILDGGQEAGRVVFSYHAPEDTARCLEPGSVL